MRQGDATIIDDGKNFEVIDGYCDKGTDHLISALKARGIKSPYLHISHAHYDHYHGIRKIIKDSYFKPKRLYCYDPSTLGDVSNDVKGEKSTMRSIISEAKAKGIPVTFVKDGDRIIHGEIKFNVYREQTGYKGNSDAYINDGSLVYWFPELSYLTSGDGSQAIGSLCEKRGIKPKFIKIPHHGNNCPRSQAQKLKSLGTLFCWDNDYSTKLTDFLMTGREDCIAVGMKYLDCHGDLNAVFFGKRAIIYKGSSIYRYACTYAGKAELKSADLAIVKAVINGKAGAGDARTSYLLNKGYNAGAVQKEVNEIVKLIKG
jgi:hypothetical protein